MRLDKRAGRGTTFFMLAAFSLGSVVPASAFAQTGDQPVSQTPAPQTTTPKVEDVIQRAETLFKQGQDAHARGQAEEARRLFDQALDTILTSGLSVSSNPQLETYYRQLLTRIHKIDSKAEDRHVDEEHGASAAPPAAQPAAESGDDAEIVEPAVLDELNRVNESELAATTPEGIKIFGKYDFEFSVAPPVFQFINFFVAGRGRSTMEIGLQRSGRYRQMAEKIFREEGVPVDLIWLAQAESVWKPNALSHAAAKGIWQFIPSTGLRFNLQQNAYVDDRSHPEKSTRAAARYLKWLHNYFAGDWLLAMAAYNSGENRVASAIARCGYADFWELHRRNLLPAETRNYVPIILSIIIISKNQHRYGFNVKPDPPLLYETYDLPDQTDLKVVADLLDIPYESVRDLNPELRRGVTPPGRYTLRLPKGMKQKFEVAYANLPAEQRMRRVVIPADELASDERPAYRARVVSYSVRRGDTLASLARRHGVSVNELARLNRMSVRGELRKGQKIRIPMTERVGKAKSGKSRYTSKAAVRGSSKKAVKKGAIKRAPAKSKASGKRRR